MRQRTMFWLILVVSVLVALAIGLGLGTRAHALAQPPSDACCHEDAVGESMWEHMQEEWEERGRLVGGWGMMGPWMMGSYGGFGVGWMLLGWLIPLGLIALVVLGVIWLAQSIGWPARLVPEPASATVFCPSCGKPTADVWVACPHCGESLKQG